MRNKGRIKKLSDYIMTFAFLYSSFICFTESANKWNDERLLAIIILICGIFSFIAIFRWQIANLIYKIRGKTHK